MIPAGLFGESHETRPAAESAPAKNEPEPSPEPDKSVAAAPDPQSPGPEPVDAPAASDRAATNTATPPVPAPAVAKPSPFEAEPKALPKEIVKIPAPRSRAVWVTTNPPGAKAVLDDDLSQTCRTPCMLHGSPGVHRLTLSDEGYENESRDVPIGETAFDLPPIVMRKPSGTLMLTTNPTGATIRIDGKLMPDLTPAQLTLPPGSYSVTVEKGGHSQTTRVELREVPVYLKIPLEQ
jgi:hypothetical protein